MIELSKNEARVLGVLIEKSTTTPEQYPLSVNAAVNGANQKSNRDPVLSLSEGEVFDGLEGLRGKTLAIRVDVPGHRVHKYRHNAAEALRARPAELAILAELLLRGPQTLGELRGRAQRMAPLDSIETTKGLLDALMARDEPLVKELPPRPGTRAGRYVQLLCANPHMSSDRSDDNESLDAENVDNDPAENRATSDSEHDNDLAQRVARLEGNVSRLQLMLENLARALGENITLDDTSPQQRKDDATA